MKNSVALFILYVLVSLPPVKAEGAPSLRLAGVLLGTNQKVIVTIQSGVIQCVDKDTPSLRDQAQNCLEDYQPVQGDPVIDTNGLISAGFFDLHNHIEFNSLPLWKEAKGQFQNRFEWRELPSYSSGPHKFYMRAMKDDPEFACLSLRWSELKALTGGVTAIQGLGRLDNETCAATFGIRNLEIESTMGFVDRSISGTFEILNPERMKSYSENLETRVQDGESYDLALAAWTIELGLKEWLDVFLKETPTLQTGLRLALGPQIVPLIKQWEDKNGSIDLKTLPRFLDQYLMSPPLKDMFGIQTAMDKDKIKVRVINWLDGQFINGTGYLDILLTDPNIQDLALQFLAPSKFDRLARQADGVIYIPRAAREYLAEFELGVLRKVRNRLRDQNILAYFTHVSEGRREDTYNAKEFSYIREFGLLQPKFVAIHGIGLTADEFQMAASRDLAVVWSPSSNLLLYGESLNIQEAIHAGVRIGLGSDWSITGTKTLLDEARVAARYAKNKGVNLTSNDFHKMLTLNSAEIIRSKGLKGFGDIALGYRADITVLSRAILTAQQEDIKLVIINGQPSYGDFALLSAAASAIGDTLPVEQLDVECLQRPKGLRLFDQTTGQRVNYRDLKFKLSEKFQLTKKSYEKLNLPQKGLDLDPVYTCEDKDYQNSMATLLGP